MNLFIKPLFLNKTFQFLLSVSILALSSSSWLPYLNTFPSLLSKYTIDRSYMFLLCNGILVFIGFAGASPFRSSSTDFQDGAHQTDYMVEKESATNSLENVVVAEKEDHKEIRNEFVIKNSDAVTNDDENSIIIRSTEEHQVAQEVEEEICYHFRDEMEESILLSTEELNRKFEEFIRRMKEEIRIGAQPQLIMV